MTEPAPSNGYDVSLEVLLSRELTRQYGPLLSGDILRNALGYPTKEAYRQAMVRKTLPVPVFELEKRRGKFALTIDVAKWLVQERTKALRQSEAEKGVAP
ncbi:UNVERIFIED_ORG: hypothetical protein DFO49_5052 [Herbaspirillum seropedicae]